MVLVMLAKRMTDLQNDCSCLTAKMVIALIKPANCIFFTNLTTKADKFSGVISAYRKCRNNRRHV